MKLLLTGKNGQLGFELQRALSALGEVIAWDVADCDLCDEAAVRRATRIAVDSRNTARNECGATPRRTSGLSRDASRRSRTVRPYGSIRSTPQAYGSRLRRR